MRFYRLLLSFYPARFREEFRAPLEQQFTDEYREARTGAERFKLWMRALFDLAWSIPTELAHELRQDLAHSLRVHARRPFVMTLTIAILALAIGGATGAFSIINAVLIKSLPFRNPEQLVLHPGQFFDSPAAFQKWYSNSAYLDDAASFGTAEMNLTGVSAPVRVIAAETSFNFFSLLGSEPALGRSFTPSEDNPGSDGVAVISNALWQQLYGSDPRVLGSKLFLNGVPMTVIGVARPGFDYPSKASVWTPTIFDWQKMPKTGVFFAQMIGRIKRGMSLASAEQAFEAAANPPRPGAMNQWNSENRPHLTLLHDQLASNIRQATLVLMAAIGFVLLIACANVANLLLTRTTERHPELMIRAALGASRARLVQQLLSETVLLSSISAAAGLLIAYWATKLATTIQPAELGAQVYTIMDSRVLAFAIGLAVGTGLLFGVGPSLLVRQLQPSGDLVRTRGAAPRTLKMRGTLIALQVALTLVLLSGSISMGRSFLHLLGTDIGFHTDHLVTISMSMGARERSEHRTNEYGREVLERLRATPGVQSAAAIDFLPLEARAFAGGELFTEDGDKTSLVVFGKVTAGYFQTMDTQVVYGREFTAADTRVAVVTEGVAKEIAAGSAVIGRRIHLGHSKELWTIVGVVRPVRYRGPEGPPTEQIFFPTDQDFPNFATFIARVHGDAREALAACRDAVQSVDPQIPVYGVKTYQARLDETLAVPRFRTTIFLFFGGFALLLAIAGIYGVSSYSITQRRREIGVRIAVGASAQGVRAMMLRQAFWPIIAGIVIGFGGAAWQGRVLEHLLPAVPPVDIASCAGSSLLLAAVAMISIWSATGRILELNPIDVLKSE